MADRARRKRRRLSRSGEFERVYREGRSHASRHLVVYAFPRAEGDDSEPRLGVSVGRKLGGAVERNRMKRLLREAGYPNGFTTTLHCPNDRYVNDEGICQAAVGMLGQIGIKANLISQFEAVEMLVSGGFKPRQTVYLACGIGLVVSVGGTTASYDAGTPSGGTPSPDGAGARRSCAGSAGRPASAAGTCSPPCRPGAASRSSTGRSPTTRW